MSDVRVTVTGPTLSRLLYENTNYSGNQIGFLLGSVLTQLTDTISDSEMSCEKIETSINITSVVSASIFYNSVGRIDGEHIMKCLQSYGRFRTILLGGILLTGILPSTFQCENRQLSEMADKMGVEAENFVFCLLSSSANKATHVFKHSFMRFSQQKKNFEVIPMQIHNLGSPQQLQYQVRPCPPKYGLMQKELMDSVGPNLFGKDCLLEAEKNIQAVLNKSITDLYAKDVKILSLKKEVEELKKRVVLKREVEVRKQRELARRSSSGVGPSVEERSSPVHLRSPDGKKLNSPMEEEPTSSVLQPTSPVLQPTSPVFHKQNTGRGQRRQSRTVVTEID